MRTKYQTVLSFFENTCEHMQKNKNEKGLSELLQENSLETFKLPKLKVFELLRDH